MIYPFVVISFSTTIESVADLTLDAVDLTMIHHQMNQQQSNHVMDWLLAHGAYEYAQNNTHILI